MQNRLFDSIAGLEHFFICPYDDFVLNSLERLDRNEYLYRLLREQKYDRVVFLEEGQVDCKIFSYDKLSGDSFLNPDLFSAVDIKQEKSISDFYSRISANGQKKLNGINIGNKYDKKEVDTREYGKRFIKSIPKQENLISDFRTYIARAINATNIKTAIVIQLEIFDRILNKSTKDANRTSALLADIIQDSVRSSQLMNIIVFTTSKRDGFVRIFNNNLLHPIFSVVNEVMSGKDAGGDYIDKTISKLEEKECIVIVDSIGTDEIANLLLRKKYIETRRRERFESLDVLKIYPIAEKLRNHLMGKEEGFASIPYKKYDTYIKTLDAYLDREAVFAEIIEKSKSCVERQINNIENAKSVLVERVTGDYVCYFNISSEEREKEYLLALEDLNGLVGLENVKATVQNLFKTQLIYGVGQGPGHYIFAGNPGTGKTEVARLMGKIFKAQGLLRSGHLVEVRKADLVAGHIGGSSIKTREKCEQAIDGVLFVDEAYELIKTDSSGEKFPSKFEEDAYTEIMAYMETHRKDMCVIFAGYSEKMKKFIGANEGMADRITEIIDFSDYSNGELYDIFRYMMTRDGFNAPDSEEFRHIAMETINSLKEEAGNNFSNARSIRKLYNICKKNAATRISACFKDDRENEYTLSIEDFPDTKGRVSLEDYEKAMKQLDEMIGLSNVKMLIHDLLETKMTYDDEKEPGHYIFAGNPGTGKTQVARLIGQIFKAQGLLSSGHLVEVNKEELVAGYTGQTAIKTRAKCEEALGGVLFVDEAYQLVSTDKRGGKFPSQFDEEAYTEIMKYMEDHRKQLCVIFAGYPEKMKYFVNANEGMADRITEVINFTDYSNEELYEIYVYMATKMKLVIPQDSGEFRTAVIAAISLLKDGAGTNFSNARAVRKLLAKSKKNIAKRMSFLRKEGKNEQIEKEKYLLTVEDVYVSTRKENVLQKGKKVHYTKLDKNRFDTLAEPYIFDVGATDSDLFGLIESSILFIKTDIGTGTAFLISPDGYALTCNHVIEGANTIEARLRIPGRQGGQDSIHKCKVINAKKDIDIALIQLEGDNFPYIKLAEQGRKIERLEKIMLPGYPFGMRTEKDMTVFTGKIGSGDEQRDANGFVAYNLNVEGKCGNSGAPIISQSDGCVIGVFTGSIINPGKKMTEEINYMHPLDYFWTEFLK